jgi:ribonucleoside-diphosphate reductase, beta subunit
MKAVNWNKQDDLTLLYWRQNIAQFWVDTEFKPSKDIKSWNEDLNEKEREAYKKVLAGLTGLDTQQGDIGMPLISVHTEDSRKQAVYSFMGMMEQIHAKSYSTIFTSLIPSKETNYLLEEWVPNNEHLQYKGRRIEKYYLKLLKPDPTYYEQYMARVASIFLESYIFYSGFFYPLYLAGQGKVTTSGEIIRKILLDETIHGSFTGIDAQEIYQNKLTIEERKKADQEMYKLLLDLYENELEYSKTIYEEIGLYEEVKDYIEYNANRALANLGFTGYFEEKDINPIIENAVNTSTKNHDFFSVKGDGYVVSLNVEAMEDEDFIF